MDGVHLRLPLALLLLARFGDLFARTARTAVATEAAAIAVAAEATALAVATEAATTAIVTLAVTIGLAHHRRGTFLVLVDADAQIATASVTTAAVASAKAASVAIVKVAASVVVTAKAAASVVIVARAVRVTMPKLRNRSKNNG